jgi:hypothetical protein
LSEAAQRHGEQGESPEAGARVRPERRADRRSSARTSCGAR